MPFHPEHLRQTVSEPLMCATCGYVLLGLPMIGRCPECGDVYNAYGERQKNIYRPYENTFPWNDVYAAAGTWLVTGVIGLISFATDDTSIAAFAIVLGLIGAVYAYVAFRKITRYLHFWRIERQSDLYKD